MMIYSDEISEDSHFKMSFIEFLEAISRVADKIQNWDRPISSKTSFDFKSVCKAYPWKKLPKD